MTGLAQPLAHASIRAFDPIPDCVIVIDAAGRIQYFSREAETLFGYPEPEIAGRHIGCLLPTADRERHLRDFGQHAATDGLPFDAAEFLAVGRRRDGGTFPMGLTIRQVRLRGEQLFTAAIRDASVTADRRRDRDHVCAELETVRPGADIDHLATVLIQTLVRPLAAIIDEFSAAAAPTSNDRAHADLASALLVEVAERAARMIVHLRAAGDQRGIAPRVENLSDTLAQARDLALARCDHAASVTIRIAENATEAVIDKNQIQQVLLNLIRNAIEAMASCRRREVTISAARVGDMIEIEVADTGSGVAPHIRRRLFQPFVTNRPGRMGVGLSLCRTIVEAHGGAIHAEDGNGGGAVFRFTVPCPIARAA